MRRDFTFIDDIAEGTVRVMDKIASAAIDFDKAHPDAGTSYAPYRIYNIGNHSPVELLEFISIIEDLTGVKAVKKFLPMQNGDVVETYADVRDLQRDVGFSPKVQLAEGLARWVQWYRAYTQRRV